MGSNPTSRTIEPKAKGARLLNRSKSDKKLEEEVEAIIELAHNGDAEAQYSVGMMYFDMEIGDEDTEDFEEAAKWFRLAADQGEESAQYWLALMYRSGTGVPYDPAEAARLMARSAELGHQEARHNLGMMYALGFGVEQNGEEALRWIKCAAENGSSSSIRVLGRMYLDGIFVQQDYAEAVRLLRLAATNHDSEAQFILSKLYAEGRGVPQDPKEADMWSLLAMEGDSWGEDELFWIGRIW